jgi:hypothetical protein
MLSSEAWGVENKNTGQFEPVSLLPDVDANLPAHVSERAHVWWVRTLNVSGYVNQRDQAAYRVPAALPPVCPASRQGGRQWPCTFLVSRSLRATAPRARGRGARGEHIIQGGRGGPSKESAWAGAAGVDFAQKHLKLNS